jgi:Ca-activated chloride channel family protein
VAYDRSGTRARAELQTLDLTGVESVEANLQQVYVTVSDRSDQRIPDLESTDFKLYDNGEPQQIASFGRGDIPFTAVLLIDASESMRGERFAAALAGADRFVSGMQPLDEAAVFVFSDRMLATTPMAAGRDLLVDTLSRTEVSGGSAINDHLFIALRAVEQRQGRRVVILLSDGEDVHSLLSMEQVRQEARRCQVQLYWARLPGPGVTPLPQKSLSLAARRVRRGSASRLSKTTTATVRVNSWQNADEQRRQQRLLEETILESGGRIILLQRHSDISAAFQEILSELREQYAIGFYPSSDRDDGSWHTLEVKVTRSGAHVRSKDGYLD